jgi:hypothetical protein
MWWRRNAGSRPQDGVVRLKNIRLHEELTTPTAAAIAARQEAARLAGTASGVPELSW